MSEEILKALVQLYAIITKQDGGVTEKEREFVLNSFKKKLSLDLVKKYSEQYDEQVGYNNPKDSESTERKSSLTSVKDSVKTLAICKKINKTLTYKQKIVALIELLELVRSDGNFTPQRMQIIDTVSVAFNIPAEEYKLIEQFVLKSTVEDLDFSNILLVNNIPSYTDKLFKHIHSCVTEGNIFFFRIESADMIFVKYLGEDTAFLNGFILEHGASVLFSNGSTLKLSKGDGFFYSDIHSLFINESNKVNLSFNIKGLEFRFPNKNIGLRDINISEEAGKLVGIMGASGAGKTTLLNVLAGLEKPSAGEVLLNGINVHENIEQTRGMMGYIAQDDLLIEELTVFENLYFNAQLCFKGRPKEEITSMVDKVLADLGLLHIKDLQVGSPLNKKISGGQRKRLNIALELIREPSILFVDEPTSGLSSRDSENVMDLLKELTRKGALIFVVIHQPSSDIYKIFDKMLILDTGGYLIFNGNPVEAVTYFKKISNQIDSENGQCQKCGNVNPEQIFNIIEEKVVDEYGNYTSNRKINPKEWFGYALDNFKYKFKEDLKDEPIKPLSSPSRITQFLIFTLRDIKSKLSNRQYLLVNILEAPLLAIILAVIVRYYNTANGTRYVFRFNDNIPAFILMSIVVSLFIGLSLSADELVKDRKIIKRESFLNLSRFSYLSSKIFILFLFSAFQMLTYVIIGNLILGIHDMNFSYWLVLFTTACMANILGLLVSSAFESAVTVYILIPLLLIPQMILSGAMFSFDKINDLLKNEHKVPVVADLMASRWAFEALAVKQYKDNSYQKNLYPFEQIESIANFNQAYVLPELRTRINNIKDKLNTGKGKTKEVQNDLKLVYNELNTRKALLNTKLPDWNELENNTTVQSVENLNSYVNILSDNYNKIYNNTSKSKESYLFQEEMKTSAAKVSFAQLKDENFNESLSDLVRNTTAIKKVSFTNERMISKIDPIYFVPDYNSGKLDYRSHFFSPVKSFMGKNIDTFYFNICFIWFLSIILFVLLYIDLFKKIINMKFNPVKYFAKKTN